MKAASSVPDSDLVPSLDVLPFHERPCAAPGLVSYRYPTGSGSWIMIGAVDHDEALRQAARSLEVGTVTISKLEVWSGMGSGYVLASPGVTLPASPVDSVGVFMLGGLEFPVSAEGKARAMEFARSSSFACLQGETRGVKFVLRVVDPPARCAGGDPFVPFVPAWMDGPVLESLNYIA